MGDHDSSSPFGDDSEGALDGGFGFVIYRAGGFIEHQDGGVAEDGAGDGDALTLTTGEFLSAFADDGVVAGRQGIDEIVGFGGFGGGFDFFLGGIGFAVGDVIADVAVEQENILTDKAHCAPKAGIGEALEVVTIERDFAAERIVEPEQEADDGGFSGTGCPNDGVGFTGGDLHGDVIENIGAFDITEGDIFEFDFALDGVGEFGLALNHLGFGLQEVVDAVGAGEESLELIEGFAESGEGPEEALGHED